MSRLALFFLSIFLLGLFTLFSREAKRGVTRDIDFSTTVRLQNKIPARFDELMDDGAILADAVVSLVMVILVTGWGFIAIKHKRLKILVIPLAFFLLTLAEAYGKNFLPHPGPPFFLVKHPTTIFPKFHVIEPYSYPSGHAARITFLAITVFFLGILPKRSPIERSVFFGILLLGYVIFVYISRIYLGHHWLSDVIGGSLLGGSFGIMSAVFLLRESSD